MKRLLRNFWREQQGSLSTTDAIIMLTMLICALVVSGAALRMAVIQELADIADGFSVLDQSYSYAGIRGPDSVRSGSTFDDGIDGRCDLPAAVIGGQAAGFFGRCITLEPAS